MDIHQSGVSWHLRILEGRRVRPRGTGGCIPCARKRFQGAGRLVSRYRALWEGRLDAFGAALERRQRREAAAAHGGPYDDEGKTG